MAIRYTEDIQSPDPDCEHPDRKHDDCLAFAQAVDEFEARRKRELIAKMKERNWSSVEIAAMVNHRNAYDRFQLERLKQAFDLQDNDDETEP